MTETITPEEYHRLVEEEGKRGGKYGAIAVVTEEGRFDSTGEHERWCALKLLRDQGTIRNLRRQVRYDLTVNGVRIAVYVADFVYEEPSHGPIWCIVVEDFKGHRTPAYRMKARLMLACHGITIRETGR